VLLRLLTGPHKIYVILVNSSLTVDSRYLEMADDSPRKNGPLSPPRDDEDEQMSQPEDAGSKRPRPNTPQGLGANVESGAPIMLTSAPLEGSPSLQQLRVSALQQAQAAANLHKSRLAELLTAKQSLLRLQQFKSSGTWPKFVLAAVPGCRISVGNLEVTRAQQMADSAFTVARSAVLDAAIWAAEQKVEATQQALESAEQSALAVMATPFACLPTSWQALPAVMALRSGQRLEYEALQHNAQLKLEQLQQQSVQKREKRAAALAAAAVERGPTDLQAQVEQLVAATLKKQLSQLPSLRTTAAKPKAKAKGATAKASTPQAGTPRGGTPRAGTPRAGTPRRQPPRQQQQQPHHSAAPSGSRPHSYAAATTSGHGAQRQVAFQRGRQGGRGPQAA
jgi:hypothetical protein